MLTFSGRKASQHPDELGQFVALLRNHGVLRYLEIGSRDGDTFHHVMRHLPQGAFGVAVDLPGGLWGRDSKKNLLSAIENINEGGRKAVSVFGDSQTPEIAAQVKEHGPFDAILIDGDHTLDGVTADWLLYGNMAPLVAFHDIAGDGLRDRKSGRRVEVPRLWRDLKARHDHREFIADGSGMGIGVICR